MSILLFMRISAGLGILEVLCVFWSAFSGPCWIVASGHIGFCVLVLAMENFS